MMNIMAHRVYWKGIYKDVKQYVADCKSCRVAKTNANKREGFMQLFAVHKPFEVVHLDIVGPLPRTKSGNRYTLTMMDRYSRMVKLVSYQNVMLNMLPLHFVIIGY